MEMNAPTVIFGAICLAGAAAYLIASWKGIRLAAVLAKAVASTSFVVLGIVNGGFETSYGRFVLAAFIFSWAGDMLLLSLRSSFLLAGIAAFFIAHIAFIAAFAMNDISLQAFFVTLAAVASLAVLILKWLWKYLGELYKIAVPLYLGAIAIMVSLAVAVSAASMPTTVAVGALAFAVSDISVARDRFIERNIINKTWGLPLYYFAQILFAASVTVG